MSDILHTPIITLEQAKVFYIAMGCNKMMMAQKAPDRYEEYCYLNISKEIEQEWKKEAALFIIHDIEIATSPAQYWWKIDLLIRIINSINEIGAYLTLINTVNEILPKIRPVDYLSIAQSYLSNSDGTSAIELAGNLDFKLADCLIKQVDHFLADDIDNKEVQKTIGQLQIIKNQIKEKKNVKSAKLS